MNLDFEKSGGLIPVIVQDTKTAKVLMLGYMNSEALEKTKNENRVTFFSRSKNRLWTKGEISGNFLEVVSITEDCDSDTLLIKATPVGPVCHKGSDTCFNETNPSNALFLEHLENIILDRKNKPSPKSYTSELFAKGINKIAQKVGEEAVELVIEAKDNDKDLFIGEAADLLYHYLVLLAAKDLTLSDVIKKLEERHK
ncbi:MAG: bifunctional phosphoribosyl-AMP cyclohydrolase/phosphoribosyl-ATP diphosphatase HisIE [Bacteroidia bacterium]